MKVFFSIACMLLVIVGYAQDTTIFFEGKSYRLPDVIVRNNLDYKSVLQRIKNDTTFYKAFRNLRVIEYSAYNNLRMLDKNNAVAASYNSKSLQHREKGCRYTTVTDQQVTGDMLDNNGDFNYMSGEMFAGLFFSKEKICGENNIVNGSTISTDGKRGIDKHIEQLKMLFFNPGKKIPGIPFIGNKLDLYDDNAHKLYDYRLDYVPYNGDYAYVFTVKAKEDLGMFRRDDVVIDEMTTWFDYKNMQVLARSYSLSYNAAVYDFDVKMEVQMTKINGLLVPKFIRYKGNFKALFKKRERGEFTATLFDFK
ncbi:hypothetical protein QTN47_08540 [Danxiaibacter flavus]|uniref:Uncharacterized protein n=1 Tax=Danxiaibacter flavus TaxID=3049108 RepID=A0ABV3ZDE2_9BACT|nr:hypothetical protein QNM32_08540 [Chitinophagaceae bacterium DXS]